MNRTRQNRLARFGRRYYIASANDHTGHDYRMQAVRVAARLAGPLSYADIDTIVAAFGDAEEEHKRGTLAVVFFVAEVGADEKLYALHESPVSRSRALEVAHQARANGVNVAIRGLYGMRLGGWS